MIHLAWPWMALLLPLPWLLYRLRPAAEPGGAALFLPFAAAVEPAAPGARGAAGFGRGTLLFALIWLLLVLAAMRPQWLGAPVPVPTSGRQVILAVDVSGSMATQDMAGGRSRLQVVQNVAGHFIDGRHGDRVGLILFGTQPYLQAPLTSDLTTVHHFLDQAVVGVAGAQTAIGDAIGLAIKRLRADTGAADAAGGTGATGATSGTGRTGSAGATRRSILVLLTDGGNNAGIMQPIQAAHLAAQLGLRIYTIGVGAPVEQDIFGVSGNTDLDEDTLRAIAKATGGRYFRATDAHALREVYREIDSLEPAQGRQQWLRPADEWFTWPLALALLLSLPATWIGGRAWA
ncbi:MAG: VWA domain-containing protein [Steroidobacteraceae bacterium]